MWEVRNSKEIICQFLGIAMESCYIEQANGRWECFERAEAASSIDYSGTRVIELIFCSPVFKVVLHHSEAGIRCASVCLSQHHYTSQENGLDHTVSECPKFSVSTP